jgi:hypothetical protein
MQFIRSMDAVKSLQPEVHEDQASITKIKGAGEEGETRRERGADDARHDPHAGPMDNARDRSLKDAAEGKEIKSYA